MNINDYFLQKIEQLLSEYSNTTEKTLLVFKGFASPQIDIILNHSLTLFNDMSFFSNGHLNIDALMDKQSNILLALLTSDGDRIAIYEQFLSIQNALPMIKGWRVILVENNLLTPWIPSCLPDKLSLEYFDYLQTDNDAKDTIKNLTLFYRDVKILDDGRSLLLPIGFEESVIISSITFWDECVPNIEYFPEEVIEINTDKDWEYRIDLLFDNAFPCLFLQDGEEISSREKALAGALSVLNIDCTFDEFELYKEPITYDDSRFTSLLKKHWGNNAVFRNLLFYSDPDRSKETEILSQGFIISEIVDQCESCFNGDKYQNIFITAPTGSGKSILFQIPAIHLANKYNLVTIVVSPLIALMNDQVDQLENDRGITIAACINSSMSFDERLDVISKIKRGEKSLLYLAPELLLTTHLESFLGGRKIGLIVIDEAHTVTSWGRDFRSDYWFLGDFLKKAKRNGFIFPVLCLTATAVYSGENDVVKDTLNELGLERTIIHIGNVKRNNISFDINRCSSENIKTQLEMVKYNLTISRIKQYISEKEKVLAYFPYKSQVDNIHNQMPSPERMVVRRYHGGLNSRERRISEKEYKDGTAKCLVCTKAFGMGVDVSDIKHIIHFAPSGTLADYIQEIGRAARNPDMQGIAHIDYFPNDIRYVRTLHGLSEMKQYQLKEMLKKIVSIYKEKKRRNLLISSETFEYLFDETEVENKTKSGLQLIAKDFNNRYSFPVIVVRPKPMLSKNYVNIPYEIENILIDKYGPYIKKQSGNTSFTQTSKFAGVSDIHIKSTGNTYLVDMDEIWEKFYPDRTFGMFKKEFFESEIKYKGKSYRLSPRIRVEIIYKYDYKDIVNELNKIITSICDVFELFKNSEQKQFTLQMFDAEITDKLGERLLTRDKLALLMDIFTETSDVDAPYSSNRSRFRVLRKRKQANGDETVYFVSSPSYARLPSTFSRMISQCNPNTGEKLFRRFYPLVKEKPVELMPLLRALELLDLATYELRGGEKAEVFIRINDPEKLSSMAYGNYSNSVLRDIKSKHKNNERLLSAFFMKDMSDEDRWDLIEEYFLGNNDYVDSVLEYEREQ